MLTVKATCLKFKEMLHFYCNHQSGLMLQFKLQRQSSRMVWCFLQKDRWRVHTVLLSWRKAAFSPAPGQTWWWAEWRPKSFRIQWRLFQSCLDLRDYRRTPSIHEQFMVSTFLPYFTVWLFCTYTVGIPWIWIGVGCTIPFFFKPLRIAVKQHTDLLSCGYQVGALNALHRKTIILFMCGRRSVFAPGGSFISLKLLIGGGMPSPSERMWNFFLTRSFRVFGMFRMYRGAFQL